jgi:excinuclease UvrABC ATPase subunit
MKTLNLVSMIVMIVFATASAVSGVSYSGISTLIWGSLGVIFYLNYRKL